MAIGTSPDFINYSGFKIDKDSSRNVFACSSFREESVEGVISSANGLVGRHLPIRLDSMLQAIEFPTGIANLATGLTNMN